MYHPVDARSILSLFEHLAMVWALGGHPETSAHPGVEGTRVRATRPLWSSHGLVGEKTLFACGAGPAGDGEASPEEYSGLRLPALHYAVGTRYSDRDMAVIRSREILAR